MRTVEKWQLGTAEDDNGLLILVAMAERKMRIEVGYGLEGTIPDAMAKRVIDEVMAAFREGQFGEEYLALIGLIQLSEEKLRTSIIPRRMGSSFRIGHGASFRQGSPFYVVFLLPCTSGTWSRAASQGIGSSLPVEGGGGGVLGEGGSFGGGGASGGKRKPDCSGRGLPFRSSRPGASVESMERPVGQRSVVSLCA